MTTLTIPTLETERLILRAPTREEFEPFFQIMSSDRSVYMGGPYARKAAYSVWGYLIASWILNGYGMWSVIHRDRGHWLGELTIAKPDHFPEPEIGWTLKPEAEGQGYASEAARAALGWAKGRVAPLVSYINVDNQRSMALAQRLGAQRDDAAARATGDTPEDTHVYRHWGAA